MVAAVAGFFFVVAAVAFFIAAKQRAAIDAAMKGSGHVKQLGMFDLAHDDAMARSTNKYLAIPERLWTYDNFYLDKFARAAHDTPLPRGGTALDAYIGPTMSADIVYAAALGLSVALFAFDAAAALLPKHLIIGNVFLFFAAMGLVYGAADVAEDLKLTSILRDWRDAGGAAAPGHFHIDGGEAAAANALTRIKFVTVCLSIFGAVVFLIFSGIAAVIYRAPTRPQIPASTAS
jgi:hypothetical protein